DALRKLDILYGKEAQERVEAETEWISLLPQTQKAAAGGSVDASFFRAMCEQHGIRQLILTPQNSVPILLYQSFGKRTVKLLHATSDVMDGARKVGVLSVAAAMSGDPSMGEEISAQEETVQSFVG